MMRIGPLRNRRASRARSPSRWACGSATPWRRRPADAFDDVILSGLTNGYSSYTATPEEYDACYYEGSFTLFGRRQGPLYRDVAVASRRRSSRACPTRAIPSRRTGERQAAAIPSPSRRRTRARRSSSREQSIVRYGRAAFSWNGGHPADRRARRQAARHDPAPGPQALEAGRDLDDGFFDILERDPETDVWTTTFQTTECMRAGTLPLPDPRPRRQGGGPGGLHASSPTRSRSRRSRHRPHADGERPQGPRHGASIPSRTRRRPSSRCRGASAAGSPCSA